MRHGKHLPSQEDNETVKVETAEIEIPIDEKNFDGEEEDIVPGTFVSYKYNGDSPFGLPITPAVSFIYLFIYYYFYFYISLFSLI